MNKYLIILFLLIFSTNLNFAQSKSDTINSRINNLEKQISELKNLPEKLDNEAEKINSRYNNVITNQGNYIGWASLLVAVFGLFLGYVAIRNFSESNNAKRRSDNILANMNTQLQTSIDTLNKVKAAEVELESTKSKIETLISNFEKSNNEFELKFKEQLNSLKTQREVDILYQEACEKLEEGSIDIAITKFKVILAKNNSFEKAECKIAMCFSAEGDHKKGKQEISKFINEIEVLKKNGILKNGNGIIPPEAFATEGIISRRLKDYDYAIKSFSHLIEDNKQKRKSVFTHLGYCYLYKNEKENLEKAIEYFKKGKIADKSSPSFYGLVKADSLLNNTVNNELLSEAIKLNTKDTLESPKYPYHNFGTTFLLLLQNDEEKLKKQLEYSLSICRNIGIIEEQLFEYEIFKKSKIELKLIDYCISEFKTRLKFLKKTLSESDEVIKKLNLDA